MIPWDVFWDYAWKIGFPFVLVCIAFGALYTRRVVTREEYDIMVKLKDNTIKERNDHIKELWTMVKLQGRVAEGVLTKAETEAGKRLR